MFKEAILKVVDNSGGIQAQIISYVYGNSKQAPQVGDIVLVVVKKALPGDAPKKQKGRNIIDQVQKGDVVKAIIVCAKSIYNHNSSGIYTSSSENCCVLLTRKLELIGTNVNSYISSAVRKKINSFRNIPEDLLQKLLSISVGEI